jgi:DNA-binding transcriptional LysR family regulator
MDQLAAIRALRRVVELGGFSQAAKVLGVSHTVVSRQVRQLEQALGAQLLNRTTRRLALTEAGHAYYDASRHILDALDDADRAVSQHQARPSGSLRINAPMAFGTIELASWLPAFIARYPELKVDLVCNDRVVDLIDEGFDVALRLSHQLTDSTLVARRLTASRGMLVASRDYLLRHPAPRTPADLLQHNCLSYSGVARPHDWLFTGPDGREQLVTVSGNLQVNTGIVLRTAALAGLGIAATSSFIVDQDLRSGALVELLTDYPMRARELYALYPHNRHLSPKVRAFVDFAVAHYASCGW